MEGEDNTLLWENIKNMVAKGDRKGYLAFMAEIHREFVIEQNKKNDKENSKEPIEE